MGCVIEKASQPHIANINAKQSHNLTCITQYQTDSANDSSQKSVTDQQANQSETPCLTPNTELKQLKSLKSIRISVKKVNSVPKLALPSNNSSLQDFSFKGSPELSFDKGKEKEANVQLPSSSDSGYLKKESLRSNITKDHTPSFAKPSSFKTLTPSLAGSHLESGSRERDNNLWSLGPIKASQVNLSPSTEVKESKAEVEKLEAQETVGKGKRETLSALPMIAERKNLVLGNADTKKDNPKDGTNSGFKFRNINHRFQKILLSDAVSNTAPSSLPKEIKSPPKENILNTNSGNFLDLSPSKTLMTIEAHSTNESITKKSFDLPDQTTIAAVSNTFNAASIATISNLVHMCKDVKKKTFEQKFRKNLIHLIQEKSQEGSDTKRFELDMPGSSNRSKTGSQVGGTTTSNNKLGSQNILSKSVMSNNLLHMIKEDSGVIKEDLEKVKPHPPPHRNKSMQIGIFEDLNTNSPLNTANKRPLNKYYMPLLPRIPQMHIPVIHSPVSKYSETSMQMEKTIDNFDEGISRLDWDKYTLCEQINNVEVDDRSMTQEGSFLETQNNTNVNVSNMNASVIEMMETKQDETLIPTLKKNISNPQTTKSIKVDEADELKIPRTAYSSNKTIQANDSLSTHNYLSPQIQPRTLVNRSGRKRMMTYTRTESQVIETNRVNISKDEEGQKKINNYLLLKEIGKGGFGKVKLAFNVEKKTQTAIKVANKKKLKRKLLTRQKSAFNQLSSEIAIMKKLDHPNIVKLYEVIDDPNNDKLYLVMEFIKRGAVMSKTYWRQASKSHDVANADEDEDPLFSKKKLVLSEDKAKKYFRHLVLGLDFLHNYAEIVHRDIKPENLLISEDDVLKISDFGISMILAGGDDLLENNAGTKYYLAPEAWEGKSFHGKPTDIWAAGGTLYYFLVGKPPFQGFGVEDLQKKIKEEEPSFPPERNLNPKAVELIKGCLRKDPSSRLSLEEIMQDPWLTDDGKNPLYNESWDKLEITEEELSKAITKVRFMAAVRVMAKLKKNLNISRRNIEKRKIGEGVEKSKGSDEPIWKKDGE